MKITPKDYAKVYLSAAQSVPSAERVKIASNFWRLVWRRGHIKWKHQILSEVRSLERIQSGLKLVEIYTPRDLDKKQKDNLVSELQKSIGQPVELVCTVKPHLLAGVVITFDHERYDGSLKGRLDSLYKKLAGDDNY